MKSAKIDRILIDQVNNLLIDTDDQDVLVSEFSKLNSDSFKVYLNFVNVFTVSLIVLLVVVRLIGVGVNLSIPLSLLLNYVKFNHLTSANFSYVVLAINAVSGLMVIRDWMFIVPVIDLGFYYYLFNVFDTNARSITDLLTKKYKYKDV